MKVRKIGIVLAICALVGMIPAGAGAANLVVNGGFEEPTVPAESPGWAIYPSGTPGLGWTVEWMGNVPATWNGYNRPDPANLELQRGNLAGSTPYEGSQKAELDSDWFGPGQPNGEPASIRVYQDVPSCPGSLYTLSYAWRPRTDGSARNRTSEMEVLWGGDVIATHSADWTDTDGWRYETIQLVGGDEGLSTRLMFRETGNPDSIGMFLDAVALDGDVSCTTDLIAGGGNEKSAVDAGDVTATFDPETCTWSITYTTHEPWELRETHLDVQCDPEDFPQTGSGNPKVGHFAYSETHEPGTTEWTYEPLSADCGCPFFAAHAVVVDDSVDNINVISGDAPVTVTRTRTPPGDFADTDSPAVAAWVHPSWNGQITAGEGGTDGQRLLDLGAQWIWESYRPCSPEDGNNATCNESIFGSVITMRTSFELEGLIQGGALRITCDNGYEAFLNGHSVGSAQVAGEWRASDLTQSYVDTAGWQSVESYDVTGLLQKGDNMLVIDAANENMEQGVDGHGQNGNNSLNPAGCIFALEVDWAREETGWGAGTDFPGRNWATYFQCEDCVAPTVTPGEPADKVKGYGSRYKSFGYPKAVNNHVYIGVGDLGIGSNRNQTGKSWNSPATYEVTFQYDADGDRIWTSVSPGGPTEFAWEDLSLTVSEDCPVDEVDFLVILVRAGHPNTTVHFNDVTLGIFPLGDFEGDNSGATWTVEGFDFTESFAVSGDIVLTGDFPRRGDERSKVELLLGCHGDE